jgi:endonuclease/exonuclease/phosphatase family metal-dependent hydrolase
MRRREIRRWLGRALLLAVAVVLAWYIAVRLLGPINAVKIISGEPGAAAAEPASGSIRIGVYNIAHGRGPGRSNWTGETHARRLARLHAIADLLATQQLDVVVLNEVDFDASWSRRVNQAAVIAERAGYAHRVEQRNIDLAIPFWSLRFGNAVLSRYPLSGAAVIDLPARRGWEKIVAGKKRALAVTVDAGRSGRFVVIAAHLEHRGEAARIASVPALIRAVDQAGLPCIVAGDLNSTRRDWPGAQRDAEGRTALGWLLESAPLRAFRGITPHARWMTFPADAPRKTIDWILATPGWRFVDYRVIDSRLSDHRPVIATLGRVEPAE